VAGAHVRRGGSILLHEQDRAWRTHRSELDVRRSAACGALGRGLELEGRLSALIYFQPHLILKTNGVVLSQAMVNVWQLIRIGPLIRFFLFDQGLPHCSHFYGQVHYPKKIAHKIVFK
jgi:hypothetical protein